VTDKQPEACTIERRETNHAKIHGFGRGDDGVCGVLDDGASEG